MCMTCGCSEWDNDHGDPKNITYHRLVDAAEAGGVTIEEAARHLHEGVQARSKPERERPRTVAARAR